MPKFDFNRWLSSLFVAHVRTDHYENISTNLIKRNKQESVRQSVKHGSYIPVTKEGQSVPSNIVYLEKLQYRSALFWDLTQRRLAVCYRRFGTIYRTHFEGSCLTVGRQQHAFLSLISKAEVWWIFSSFLFHKFKIHIFAYRLALLPEHLRGFSQFLRTNTEELFQFQTCHIYSLIV